MATLAAVRQQAIDHLRADGRWLRVLRAMGQTGSASILSSLFTISATKILAVVLGPAAVAVLATLRQLRDGATSSATLFGQTALVQGASRSRGDAGQRFIKTAVLLIGLATAIVCCGLLMIPGPIAALAGLDPSRVNLIRGLAVPVVLGGIYIVEAALLNALGAIGTLAKLQLAAPAATLVLAYPVATRVGEGREWLLVGLLTLSSAVAVCCAARALFLRRVELTSRWFHGRTEWWDAACARRFFAISGSLLTSGLVIYGVLVLLRGGILREEGLSVGGQFDAAWAISMNYVTLLLASMQTYFLPTLVRMADPDARAAEIRRVVIIGAVGAAALIVVLSAVKPLVISTLYSESFLDAVRYLRWTLLGDYLKVTGWILSIPLIASADMRAFLTADLVANVVFLAGGGWLLPHWFSAAESVAAAFVAMCAVHMTICAVALWQKREFRADRILAGIWLAGLAAVLAASASFWNQGLPLS